MRVQSKGPLVLGDIPLRRDRLEGELSVEVHPMQLDGYQATGQFWLPAYLSQWNGKSLVLPDEDAAAFFQTEQATGQAANLGPMYNAVGLDDIPLRYGKTYDFRVRLMDPTGGGPVAELPRSGIAGARRDDSVPAHVVPEPVRIRSCRGSRCAARCPLRGR